MSANLWNKIHKINEFKSQLSKALSDVDKLKELAIWENDKLENQIHAETLRRYRKAKSKEAEELNKKKEHLKAVLTNDENKILKDCKTASEEKAERLKYLRAQAELLEKQKKETDEKIALEKYDQRLREQSAELRQELSKRRAKEIARDLLIQIEMKRKQNLLEKRQNDYLDKRIANVLRRQIERKEQEKLVEKAEKLKQANALEELNKQLKQEKEDEVTKKKLGFSKVKLDLEKCLQEKLLRKSEEHNQEAQYDNLLTLLNQQVDKERSGNQRDKVTLKKEALQYLEHVRDSKEAEKMYEEEISRSIDEHIAKQQNLGHHKKMQLLVARENLKNDVNKVCRQQIVEKRKKQDEEKLEHIEEVKELNEIIERMKLDSKYELQLRRQNVETYRNALERQIADQRTRYKQLIADNSREFEKNKKKEEQLTELVHNIVNSNETDYNRHPWQKLLATGHWSIPVWDGELQISKFASARY
ncbi:unnamed protein product [Schistosoma margrebowiei]|uniref:Uncharacterized protein n=1 Tax=Schistosoma margrebowiei TaxID=48269 RepID=A0A183LSS3_9TREM|nr:unnamed protein product [Schistosoma margrebowiei]